MMPNTHVAARAKFIAPQARVILAADVPTDSRGGQVIGDYGHENQTSVFRDKKQLFEDFVNICKKGNFRLVHEYLSNPQCGKYLINKADDNSDTALIHTASQDRAEILELLLDYGADIDARNFNEDSALMVAAAHGQLRNIFVLRVHEANREFKNKQGQRAVDLVGKAMETTDVGPLRRLQDKHWTLGLLEEGMRTLIPQYLQFKHSPESSAMDNILRDIIWEKSSTYGPCTLKSLRNNTPIKELRMPRSFSSDKTFACMFGTGSSITYAMSGSTHSAFDVIAGDRWTDKVLEIAKTIGHTFGDSVLINPDVQRSYASHTEPQLIAYQLSKLDIRMAEGPTRMRARNNRHENPFRIPIIASQHVCNQCRKFENAVNEVIVWCYGFAFDLQSRVRFVGMQTREKARDEATKMESATAAATIYTEARQRKRDFKQLKKDIADVHAALDSAKSKEVVELD